jgi:hypothetical protein
MLTVYIKESETRLWMERRNESPNDFYDQTTSGLFLELYYGMPSILWTPWGKYNLGGSGSGRWEIVVSKLVERLGGTLHRAQRYEPSWGEIGEVYALSKIDDLALPLALVRPRDEYMPYEEAKRSWAEIVARLGAHE